MHGDGVLVAIGFALREYYSLLKNTPERELEEYIDEWKQLPWYKKPFAYTFPIGPIEPVRVRLREITARRILSERRKFKDSELIGKVK